MSNTNASRTMDKAHGWDGPSAFEVIAGFAASMGLVALWHLGGLATPPEGTGYPFTKYLTGCIDGAFVMGYVFVGCLLGWISRRAWTAAAGMMLALPLAFGIEVFLDPTSHNLIPFEILLFWVPAFGVAYGGVSCGRWIRARTVPDTTC